MNIYDEKTIAIVSEIFSGQTGIALTATTDEYEHYDLDGITRNKTPYRVEVKGRGKYAGEEKAVYSFTYSDHMINRDKYDALITSTTKTYIATIYDDNVVAISDVKKPLRFERKYTKHTTKFENQERKEEEKVIYNQTIKVKFAYDKNNRLQYFLIK